jgi:RNA polymerase sigma factor (sigma-70 family)
VCQSIERGLFDVVVVGEQVRYESLDPPARSAAPQSASDLPAVVTAAARGEPWAWTSLMQSFGNLIMAIARSCRLNDADVNEVHQTTWLRLIENIDRIEQPDRIGAWLATTAKRESLRLVRSARSVTYAQEQLLQRPDTDLKAFDAGPIAEERAEVLRRALALLPPHCYRLLSLMVVDDPPSYKEISRALSMPIGSIGPTRGRCLEHLRRIMEELGVDA